MLTLIASLVFAGTPVQTPTPDALGVRAQVVPVVDGTHRVMEDLGLSLPILATPGGKLGFGLDMQVGAVSISIPEESRGGTDLRQARGEAQVWLKWGAHDSFVALSAGRQWAEPFHTGSYLLYYDETLEGYDGGWDLSFRQSTWTLSLAQRVGIQHHRASAQLDAQITPKLTGHFAVVSGLFASLLWAVPGVSAQLTDAVELTLSLPVSYSGDPLLRGAVLPVLGVRYAAPKRVKLWNKV